MQCRALGELALPLDTQCKAYTPAFAATYNESFAQLRSCEYQPSQQLEGSIVYAGSGLIYQHTHARHCQPGGRFTADSSAGHAVRSASWVSTCVQR